MKGLLIRLFTPPAEKRVFGLDFLRALAILAVLLTHGDLILGLGQRGGRTWFSTATGLAGSLGVELFFVLSGFLIGSILLALEPKFHHLQILPYFWQRRWFRTLPNYYFFLLLYIAATLVLAKPLPNLLEFATFTQNWLWPHPKFFDQAWSLAVEEWFYLLFPLSLFIFYRLTRNFDAAFLLSAGLFILLPTAIRFDWAAAGLGDWSEQFRKVMFVRLDAIMYGVLAAWAKRKYSAFWERARFPLLGAGILLLFAVWGHAFTQDFTTSIFNRTLLFSFTSLGFALMLPACDGWETRRETFASAAIRLIAVWSYSLYLSNFLLVQVLTNLMEAIGPMPRAANFGFLAFYLVSSLLVSALLYTFLERPAMQLRERLPKV